MNEASPHTFPAAVVSNPCKYCWAGGEAEREAVVVGAAAAAAPELFARSSRRDAARPGGTG